MNITAILGLIVAFGSLIGSAMLEHIDLMKLVQLNAFVIVFGASVGAILLQFKGKVCLAALAALREVFKPTATPFHETAVEFRQYAADVRSGGIIKLEAAADNYQDEVVKKALMLAADGHSAKVIRSILETEIYQKKEKIYEAGSVYGALGGYAPTMGILGAVLGLMHTLGNLDDPSKLGSGISSAFVATIYGVFLANGIFFPLGEHLSNQAKSLANYWTMVLEGTLCIVEGTGFDELEERMKSYIPHNVKVKSSQGDTEAAESTA